MRHQNTLTYQSVFRLLCFYSICHDTVDLHQRHTPEVDVCYWTYWKGTERSPMMVVTSRQELQQGQVNCNGQDGLKPMYSQLSTSAERRLSNKATWHQYLPYCIMKFILCRFLCIFRVVTAYRVLIPYLKRPYKTNNSKREPLRKRWSLT